MIVMVEDYTLIERMASSIVFMKYDGRKKGALVRCDPPMGVAATLRQRGYGLKLPALVAVVNCPQFKANGQIMDAKGYDPATGIFYDPRDAVFPSVPAHPTKEQAATALKNNLRLYETFDFDTENDLAVAVSLVLTLLAEPESPSPPCTPSTRQPPDPANPSSSTSPASSPPDTRPASSRKAPRPRSSKNGSPPSS